MWILCEKAHVSRATGLVPGLYSKMRADFMRDARLPTLDELGEGLRRLTPAQRIWTLTLPFLWVAAYFGCAARGLWAPAIAAAAASSFVSFASTSHDLVHGTLGLPPRVNDAFLSLIELLSLRSGHAYRLAHLHHHARYPREDDVEGRAAHMGLVGALLEGPSFHVRIWLWALRQGRQRACIALEGAGCVGLVLTAAALARSHPAFAVYAGLAWLGSWTYPLMTAYVPHAPAGEGPLLQTRAFRGRVAHWIAGGHLYHLEHHLYPMVPHHHWPRLAQRLDPYLARAGVRPIRFWV
jgi:beta-carotene hydroxylase